MGVSYFYDCDNPACKETSPISDKDEFPDGWFEINAIIIGTETSVIVYCHEMDCIKPALVYALATKRDYL